MDGWVSLEVSPLLAHDTQEHAAAAKSICTAGRQAQPVHQDSRHPRGPAGHRGGDLRRRAGQRDAAVLARAIHCGGRGLPAWHRAPDRGGPEPGVGSVASLFISRWDIAVAGKVPAELHNRLGIAVGAAHLQGLSRAARLAALPAVANAGARPQRLLWASTGTKDPKASDMLYVKALAAPFTVNTMPEGTLPAFADHGEVGAGDGAGRRRCENGARELRQGRHRRRRARGPAAGRRRRVIREVVERADGLHRVQERRRFARRAER